MNQEKKYIVLDIETDGLCPWYGNRITCICTKDGSGKIFKAVHKDELKMINSLLEWLRQRDPQEFIMVSKNGIQFDIPFILTRFTLLCNHDLEKALLLLEYEHLDLQELTRKKLSLDDMARLFKCHLKIGTGEGAISLWKEGKIKELREYCMQDVETTEEVYLKWKSLK